MTRAEREALIARTNENKSRFDAALAAITPEDREYLARIYDEILGGAENGDSTGLRAPWDWMISDQVWQLTAIHRLRAAMQEACDLLAERTHASPARSPGHNARLLLERTLTDPTEDTKPQDSPG